MEQPRFRSFQARATQLLKKLTWRTRSVDTHSKDNLPVAPTNVHPLPPSPDVLHKPDMSSIAGLRLDDTSIPTDTDDSSSMSPTRQSRRYSAWDSRSQPSASPVLPAPTSLLRETTAPESAVATPNCDQDNTLTSTPLFPLAGSPTAPLAQTANDRLATPSNTLVSQDTSSDQSPETERPITPQPMQGLIPSNEPATNTHTSNTLVEPESSQPPVPHTVTISTTIHERRLPGTQITATLPPPFRVATDRGLRLSPSIISRQPLPILRLPVLPVPTPAQETPPIIHLRHVPSLSVHGRPRVEPEPDSPTGDGDEDYGEDDHDGDENEGSREDHLDHQSDEDGDGEEIKSYSQPQSPLREIQTPVFDLTQPIVGPSSRPFLSPYSPAGASSTPSNVSDNVSSKTSNNNLTGTTPIQGPSTSRLLSPKTSFVESIHARSRITPMTSIEVNHGQSTIQVGHHPGLYRQPSRSMIDLSVSRKDLRLKKSRDTVRSNVPSVSGNTTETVDSGDTDRIVGKLMRRTSMPTFTASSDPPPYPSFDPRPQTSVSHTLSREDEGREGLPPYSNSLYLSAIMPCKMEFSSPGVQAKDRKWRRVFCELEGTLLRVYKCPPGASGAGIIGEWWERRVGVGDLTSGYHVPRRKPDEGAGISSSSSSSKMGSEQPAASPPSSPLLPPNRERSESQSSRATNQSPTPSTSRGNRRMSGTSFLAPWRSSGSTSQLRGRGAPPTNQAGPSGGIELLPVSEPPSRRNSLSSSGSHEESTPSTPRTPRAQSRLGFLSSKMQMRNGDIQKPGKGELIRAYTLQYAESGLGNDYLKRKNVIRVRLEGEQFLLQAADVPSVVEWIEGFQAGTNIALDLDQRVMPKGPMFPRRRRRRARATNRDRAGAPPPAVVM